MDDYKIGDEYDLYNGSDSRNGGIVPDNFDFSSDARFRDMSDAEIAARMQAEEYNPGISTADDLMRHELKDPYDVADNFHLNRDMDRARDRTLQQQREALDAKNREIEQRNREVERLNTEKEAMRKERDLEREKLLLEQRANQLRQYTRPLYNSDLYSRIYDWSLGLIPDYYSYTRKKQLEEMLEKLIKKEISNNKTESELEDKIRDILKEANTDKPSKSKKSKKQSKTKKQSKKKSAKKSTKKSAKKSAKKT